MSATDYHQLLRTAAARALTSQEERRLEEMLAGDAERRNQWETDLLLERALQRLPNPSISSNFTAQVLAAVQRTRTASSPRRTFWQGWFGWRWSPALGALILAALFLFQNHRQNTLRAEVAQSIETFSKVATILAEKPSRARLLPAPEMPPIPDFQVFRDFDAISQLDLVPQKVDMDLLLALQ